MTNKDHPQMLFQFGLMSDIQYADIEPAHNFGGHEHRDYRASLQHTATVLEQWSQLERPLTFMAQLGDLIDGQNAGGYGQGLNFDEPQSHRALQRTLDLWQGCPTPLYHAIGNHELYNFEWSELSQLLNRPKSESGEGEQVISRDQFYHSFSPSKGWRFIILNSYEENMIQPRSIESGKQIKEKLIQLNPNLSKAPPVNFFEGLSKNLQRYVPFNGGFGKTQLEWLRHTLEQARRAGERCLIATHLPVSPKAASYKNIAFDAYELLNILRSYSQQVVAYFAGHRHGGGYGRGKKSRIHHITLQAPLTHGVCASIVEVYEDRLELIGIGAQQSYRLDFN